ncbi:radical SAM protein [Corynebacterium poyangense]|uniref:Radical SAM protein n=1 Tax=Corynebacterium poyangense TaxID=2684405 RepID=A0A7H0SLH0_9CORY|nr:radical SAM protein [Corynebacterium poyangense]QNQ89395.1 radical SAM protein [Corynebacterium poyangense]
MPIIFLKEEQIKFSRWLVKSPGKLNLIGKIFAFLIIQNLSKYKSPPEQSYTITYIPGFSCNLSCEYCFQLDNQGTRPSGRDVWSNEKALQLTRIVKERCPGSCNLIVLGGEPLVYKRQIDILYRKLKESLAIRVTLITNGTLLNENSIDWLKSINCRTVQVSIDGGPRGQDLFRKYRNHRNSYQDVLAGIRRLLAKNFQVHIRVNIFSPEKQDIHNLIEDLGSLPEKNNLIISFVPVDQTLSFKYQGLNENTLISAIRNFYENASARDLQCVAPLNHRGCAICDVKKGEELKHGIVLGPNSKLYSCWDTAGASGFEIGTLSNGLSHDCTSSRWKTCGSYSSFNQPFWDRLSAEFKTGVERGSYERT